jgi:competence protein ComEC
VGSSVDGASIRERCEVFLAGERPHWPGWLAVAVGLGAALYFALPAEPPRWAGALATAGLCAAILLLRRRLIAALLLAALLAMALGFAAAQFRTAWVAAPQLQDPIRFAHVTGRVATIEPYPNAVRLTLEQVSVAELAGGAMPHRLQIKVFKGREAIHVGDRLDLLARLQPPSPPVAPGAFDFRRDAYFKGIGGTGFALGAPRVLAPSPAPGVTARLQLWIDGVRAAIGQRIATLEPDAAGAMARALTVGDQTALTKADTEAMRISGLAHLLSISGLHIGMAAALFFVGLRSLLALIPALALRWPIKKWSAAAAILAAGYYALLAGATVPTLRSFVMIALAFLAVMLDRSPISFRMLAWAAVIVLLVQPESVTGASFQMSFFAVLGLVAVFEALRPRLALWRGGRGDATDTFGRVLGWMRAGVFWFATTILTSVIASLMTAPFAMYHFDRVSTFGVVANMVAVPLTGFWIMPMGMAALLLMPFGLDAPFWHAAAWGCDGVLWIAHAVASWPLANIVTPAMPVATLLAIALGLVLLCLLRSRWRLLGAAPVAVGLMALLFATTPDLLVSGDAGLVALKDQSGAYRLSKARATGLAAETWLRWNGQAEATAFPQGDESSGGLIACDSLGCRYSLHGRAIAIAFSGEALAEDCRQADLVLSLVPVRRGCTEPIRIDRFDIWRGGAHALWVGKDGLLRIESVAARLGDRPWVLDRMRDGLRSGRLADRISGPLSAEASPRQVAEGDRNMPREDVPVLDTPILDAPGDDPGDDPVGGGAPPSPQQDGGDADISGDN